MECLVARRQNHLVGDNFDGATRIADGIAVGEPPTAGVSTCDS